MKEMTQLSLVLLFGLFSITTVKGQPLTRRHSHKPIDPYRFVASLEFDGKDWLDEGEKFFPVSYKFNTFQDANGDGIVNQEDNLENYVPFAIGTAIYGVGVSGIPNRGPNDQRPAAYYHHVHKYPYTIHQYWLYYVDNDWINNHEHEWEVYFIYTINGVITHVGYSWHDIIRISTWCEIRKDGNHPLIGVDGGSHAMKNDPEDGVIIKYNGEIYRRNGTLNVDSIKIPWVLYSNDTAVINVVPYVQVPDSFFYGDPFHNSGEYSDPRPAPWMQYRWTNPEVPSSHPAFPQLPDTVFLCPGDSVFICADIVGSMPQTITWNTGDTTSCIYINLPGKYWITVTSIYTGCRTHISDTTVVILLSKPTILEKDTIYKCMGQSVSFEVPSYVQLVSCNGKPCGNILNLDSAGNIELYYKDSFGCVWSDTLYVIDTFSWIAIYPIDNRCFEIKSAFVDTIYVEIKKQEGTLFYVELNSDTVCMEVFGINEGDQICIHGYGLCGQNITCLLINSFSSPSLVYVNTGGRLFDLLGREVTKYKAPFRVVIDKQKNITTPVIMQMHKRE